MKTEFYYNKHKYTCSISKVESGRELRIKNERGEILAIEQGRKIGLRGEVRENARGVDVSDSHLYNLIKAATSAIEITEKNHLILEKDNMIDGKNEQISNLNQQLIILRQTHNSLSFEQEQKLIELEDSLKEREAIIEDQKQLIVQLEDDLTQIPQILPFEKIEEKVISEISNEAWICLHSSSQRDLCNADRYYQLAKSEDWAGQLTDFSDAGHPLGIVAEREIVIPFFRELYQFMYTSNKRISEIGGITLRRKGTYTLGELKSLLIDHYTTFIDDVLEQEDFQPGRRLYFRTSGSMQLSQTDKQLMAQFLQQWQHPLSRWLASGEIATSKVDQIRKLRNIANHPDPMYEWQFNLMRSLLVGGNGSKGVLQQIYGSANASPDNLIYITRGTMAFGSPPSSLQDCSLRSVDFTSCRYERQEQKSQLDQQA